MPSNDVLALTGLEQLSRWNVAAPLGTSVAVTYSFGASRADYDDQARPGFAGFSATQQSYIRQALDVWAAVSGLTFVEVSDSVGGQMRFGMFDMTGMQNATGNQVSGFGYFPGYTYQTDANGVRHHETYYNWIGGDIFMNSQFYAGDDFSMAPGQRGYSIMLHEIGHAIGFKHPFEGTPTIQDAHDNAAYTVMSYNRPNSTVSLGSVDIEAVRYYYGTQDFATSYNAATMTITRSGTSSNDWILGTELSDVLNGFSGNDTLNGAWGNDTLNGGAGNDILLGSRGDDTLNGGDGNDTLYGGDDEDVLNGGGGNDRFLFSYGTDTFNGGSGTDTVDASLFPFGTTISIESAPDVENIIGSPGNDYMTGNAQANTMDGGEGVDTFFGRGGNDILLGGPGADYYNGDADTDTVDFRAVMTGVVSINLLTGVYNGFAANGDTYISIERFFGTNRNDYFAGDYGDNSFRGFGGNDYITGRWGVDYVDGGDGNDALYGGVDDDVVVGGNGNDGMQGGDGNDVMKGDAGNDVLLGGAGNDVLTGGPGNDTMNGGSGNDLFYGGQGADIHRGSSGSDTVDYSQVNIGVVSINLLTGQSLGHGATGDQFDSIENLTGTDRNDYFAGDYANNVLRGGDGNDVLQGRWGDDTVDGGNGNDSVYGGVDDDTVTGGNGNDGIQGGDGNDYLGGGSGNDVLLAGAGNDTLVGFIGNDRLVGGTGNDTNIGGTGMDVFVFHDGFGQDTITDFTDGEDKLEFYGVSSISTLADFNAARSTAGNDVIVTVGADQLTIINGAFVTWDNGDLFV